MSDSLQPLGLCSPWNPQGQNTGVVSRSLLQGNLPKPEIEPRSPTLQADSLPSEPQGMPKKSGVSSLSLSQGNFPFPGIEPGSPAFLADSLPAHLPGKLFLCLPQGFLSRKQANLEEYRNTNHLLIV